MHCSFIKSNPTFFFVELLSVQLYELHVCFVTSIHCRKYPYSTVRSNPVNYFFCDKLLFFPCIESVKTLHQILKKRYKQFIYSCCLSEPMGLMYFGLFFFCSLYRMENNLTSTAQQANFLRIFQRTGSRQPFRVSKPYGE